MSGKVAWVKHGQSSTKSTESSREEGGQLSAYSDNLCIEADISTPVPWCHFTDGITAGSHQSNQSVYQFKNLATNLDLILPTVLNLIKRKQIK